MKLFFKDICILGMYSSNIQTFNKIKANYIPRGGIVLAHQGRQGAATAAFCPADVAGVGAWISTDWIVSIE